MKVRVPRAMERYATQYVAMARTQIGDALRAGPATAFKTLGHNLKGSAPSFGLAELGRLGADLEAAADARDQDALERAVHALQTYLAEVEMEFG